MSEVTLAILIPTRNRSLYLKELLVLLLAQTYGLKINIYVRDNCSSDNTKEIVSEYQKIYKNLSYLRNDVNIGAAPNFLLLINNCKEDYFWLFGDDELINDHALEKIMKILSSEPDYLVFDGIDGEYSSSKEYIRDRMSISPNYLVSSTLITSNIVKRKKFDINYASTKYATHYGHMYAIFKGLDSPIAKIVSSKNIFFIVRKVRASPIDGDWPLLLELEWDKYLKFLCGIANINFPWFKLGWINQKRKARYFFGSVVSRIIGMKVKELIKIYILRR